MIHHARTAAFLIVSIFLVALPGFSGSASAQDGPQKQTILVLDASGSMWGQIEGEAKITIARRVLADLLGQLPSDQSIGLMAYGHNRKGDCADIELLVEPGPETRDAIVEAVNGLNPRGMTPLSDAVIAAAEQLRSTEEAATVILVSDGRETCDMDPCAVGTQLEETGVDFTAHVVGFDVAEEEERAQLQCLAENTGGRFLTASNADELSEALEEVSVEEPEPAPQRVDAVFEATDGEGGDVITSGLVWTLTNTDDGSVILDGFDVAAINMALEPGNYLARVARASDGATAELAARVDAADGASQRFALPLESNVPDATVTGPASAIAGSTILVEWTGPDEDRDYVSVALPDATGSQYINYAYTRDGNPLRVTMPPEPGDYELRYIRRDGTTILASQPISIEPVDASISAPSTATAGSTITIDWEGPDYDRDYISVARLDQTGSQYTNYAYTRDGSPAKLVMPPEPGEYEIRYIQRQDATILASVPITIEAVSASISAPATAIAGSTVTLEWEGPDYDRDYISIAEPDQTGSQYVNYAYTRDGSPAKLVMPPEPGSYEIRYIQRQDATILASVPITIEAVSASISAPASAIAGSTVTLEWEGPDYDRDYISIAEPDQTGSQYVNYAYTRDGSPAKLVMPSEPGGYEIRYIQRQDATILATAPITVEEVSASISGPSTAAPATEILVQWEGPDYDRDYVAIARPDQTGSQQETYAYTREGTPLRIKTPEQAGEYELRYIMRQDGRILARMPLRVE